MFEIGNAIHRSEVPAKGMRGGRHDKYAAVWSTLAAIPASHCLPVTCETPKDALNLVQAAKVKGYRATQRGNVAYVSKGLASRA